MSDKQVWTGISGHIYSFLENNGIAEGMQNQDRFNHLTDEPLYSYCYFQNFSYTEDVQVQKRKSTGDTYPRNVVQEKVYNVSISGFYWGSTEISDITTLNRVQKLTLVMILDNPLRGVDLTGELNNMNQIICKGVNAKNIGLSFRENSIVDSAITFWPEYVKKVFV